MISFRKYNYPLFPKQRIEGWNGLRTDIEKDVQIPKELMED